MTELFLNVSMANITKYYPEYDEVKLAELKYGLEGIYLSITKFIVITSLSIILGIFFEMIIMLIVFNILRATGFGVHAKKSIDCWISSTIIFLLFPWISKFITIPIWLHIIISIILISLISIYAPADTKKRPLINKKKRLTFKFITIINTLILIIISFLTEPLITNLILFGILTETIMINPIIYKMWGLPYRNYKNYGLNSNV